jgi:PAS domain S-box-containing protein
MWTTGTITGGWRDSRALRIAVLYATFAGLWIVISDHLLAARVRDPDEITRWAIVKGWLFVAVTAALLYLERRHADRAIRQGQRGLREVTDRLRAVIDNTNGIVCVKDLEGRFLLVNRYLTVLLGKGEDAILGRTASELFSPEVAQEHTRNDRQVIESGKSDLFEESSGLGAARRVFLSVRFLLRDADGNACSLGAICTDITDRKRLQEQLLQAQKMEAVGRLAGGVAHDFRNQLTIIKGYGDILARHGALDDEGREYVKQILDAAERSAQISQQLLAFSRRQVLRPEVVHLGTLLGEFAKSLAKVLGEHIRLSLELGRGVGNVRLDPTQFQQTIMNLVLNARDAMPRGGQLTVLAENADVDDRRGRELDIPAGPYVAVTVSDTGGGMDGAALTRAFEPFFTTKPAGEGTGLGLAMVHGFVRQSGGGITAESSPGAGTTLRLYFPRVGEPADAAKYPVGAEDRPRGLGTLLVVEDEASLRHVIGTALRECGYTVLESANAREAIPLVDNYEGKIDLLITDVVMPGLTGPELASHLLTKRPDTPVLFISGHTGTMLADRGIVAGEANLLVKPFDSRTLSQAVGDALQRTQSRHGRPSSRFRCDRKESLDPS